MQSSEQVEREAEPKRGLKRGTPEGDKLIRVRVMKPCTYGPSIDLEKQYNPGDVLTIPAWRYTSWNNPEEVKDKDGKIIMKARGTFEPASWFKPSDDGVSRRPENMQTVIDENEKLRQRLAILESGALPDKNSIKRQEI